MAAAVAIVVWVFDLTRYFSLEYVKSQLDVWRAQAGDTFFVVAAAFFVLYVAVTALSIPGAAVMTLLAGALFDAVWGTIIVSFASTLGATAAFLIARFFLRESVAKKFGNQFEKINKGMQKDGPFYLFALRMAPVFPFFIINLAMGLTKIRVLTYMLVSQVGMLPGTIAYVLVGRSLANIDGLGGLVSPALWLSFVFLAVVPIISKRIVDAVRAKRVYKPFAASRPKKFDYNVAIIGAGSGGLVAASVAAFVKAKVALFEKDEMGGDCLNRGCVPSKALIAAANLAAVAEAAKEAGVQYAKPAVSFSRVMKSVHNAITSVAPHDSVERYQKLGVECVREEAQLISPWEIKTKTRTITAQKIIIATGSSPVIPNVPGLAAARPYTTDTIWSLAVKPNRMLVIGGGPVGCELSRAFSLLGVSVTLVQRREQLLEREDEDVAAAAKESLARGGVTVYTGASVKEVKKSTRGEFIATVQPIGKTPQEEKVAEKAAEKIAEKTSEKFSVPFDLVLVAAGRRARSTSAGDALSLARNTDGTIATDEYMRTSIPNIYAAGDVAGPYQLTHIAGHTGWYAAANALFGAVKKFAVDYRAVPTVTFLEPEIGRVGLNEKEARERGIAHEVTKYEMADLDRALAERKIKGFIKVLTVPKKDTILGAAVVAERGGEILAQFTLAMQHKLGLRKLLQTIHPYPTFGEAVKGAGIIWQRARVPKQLLGVIEAVLSLRLKGRRS